MLICLSVLTAITTTIVICLLPARTMGLRSCFAMNLRKIRAVETERLNDGATNQKVPQNCASFPGVCLPPLRETGTDDSGSEAAPDDSGSEPNLNDHASETSLDVSDSGAMPVDTKTPLRHAQVWISDPKLDTWGRFPRSAQDKCSICFTGKGSHRFKCSTFTIHNCPPAFQIMLKTVRHFLSYLCLEDALQNVSHKMRLLPTPDFPQPPVLTAMGLDWDTTCTQPFLKRLLHFYGLSDEVICVERSKKNDGGADGDVDMVLCLKGSNWRPVSSRWKAFETIPICPIVVQDGAHGDSLQRLEDWFSEYYDCLEQNGIAHKDHQWPVPYFVVDGDMWRFGFAVECGSDIEFYEELIGSMGWANGVQKVLAVLRHVIELTAECHRGWYLEHSR